jgi:hypothetical protein
MHMIEFDYDTMDPCDAADLHCIGFESIPQTFWFTIVTMTSVGYGDVYPSTELGKLVGMVIMLAGILVIAIPITLIGNHFNEAWVENKVHEKEVHLRNNMRHALSKAAVRARGSAASLATECQRRRRGARRACTRSQQIRWLPRRLGSHAAPYMSCNVWPRPPSLDTWKSGRHV